MDAEKGGRLSEPEHGKWATKSGYLDNCQCENCKRENREREEREAALAPTLGKA